MDFLQADTLNEMIRAIGLRHRGNAIAALEPLGIHPGHKLLLLELETSGPRTLSQLASACGYEPPTITMSVRQLEEAGLVSRVPSTEDKRVTIVILTDAGLELLPKLKEAWLRLAEQTVAGLTHTTLEELREVLGDLAQSLIDTDVDTGARHPAPKG